VLRRFFFYGCVGWVLEVAFTGAHAAVLGKDRSATAKTYLWMHPIYGGAGLLLEGVARRLQGLPRAARALGYLPLIYAAELATGWMLRRALGKCPWEYRDGLHYRGLVRLDYAPVWYLAALAFEPISAALIRATREPRLARFRRRALPGW
jgi:hypothetical protein